MINPKMHKCLRPVPLIVLMLGLSLNIPAQEKIPQSDIDKYTKGREARLKDLNDAKFGMFIHWGPYAVLAGEWNGSIKCT